MLFALTQKDSGLKFLVVAEKVAFAEVNETTSVGGVVLHMANGSQRVVIESLEQIAAKLQQCCSCSADFAPAPAE